MENSSSKPIWIPLESNPEAFNQYISKLDIKGIFCQELYGLESELLGFTQGPHYALIFCYPYSEEAANHMKGIYENLTTQGKNNVPDGVFFMKQKIGNACGTFSLLHSLTNTTQHFDIGNGPFFHWFEKAKPLGVQERSDCLFNDKEMSTAHLNCAERGETEAPEVDKVEFHFIAYVNSNGRLMEFDSAQNFPRDCGPTTDDTLLVDAGKECLKLSGFLNDIRCNALALVQSVKDE